MHELIGEQPALAQEDMYDDAAAVAAYQLPPEPEPVATEPEEVSAEEADELPAVDPGSIKQKDELVADNAAEPPLESSEASTESDQRATPDNQEVVE